MNSNKNYTTKTLKDNEYSTCGTMIYTDSK